MDFSVGQGNTAILFIPGFAEEETFFRPLAEHLAGEEYTCFSVLPDGFGPGAPETGSADWKTWLRQCRDAVLQLKRKYKTVYAAGHAAGGILAILLGEENLVDGVISLSAPLLYREEIRSPARTRLRARFSRSAGKDGEDASVPALDGKTRRDLVRLSDTALARLSDLRAPLLILDGERDEWGKEACAALLYESAGSVYKEVFSLDGTMEENIRRCRAPLTEYVTSFLARVKDLSESAESGPLAF